MALERETEIFEAALPGLLADPKNHGWYALVGGNEVAGVYPTEDAALAAGYARFELAPFMIREVTERRRLVFFPRFKCRSRLALIPVTASGVDVPHLVRSSVQEPLGDQDVGMFHGHGS